MASSSDPTMQTLQGQRVGTQGHTITYDLFVGNLSEKITKDDLMKLFGQFGTVQSIQLSHGNKQPETMISFVRYLSREDAVEGVKRMHGYEVYGRAMHVKPATKNGKSWANERGNERGKSDNRQQFENGTHPGHTGHVGHTGHRPAKTEQSIGKEVLILSHHDSPIEFWGQSYERLKDLEDLSDQLQLVCPCGQAVAGKPKKDKIYATTFSSDALWYRCKAINQISDSQTEVLFIDYGNTEIKENSEIREILQNLAAIKPHAAKYSLYGLKCLHDVDSMGYGQGCMKLLELLGGTVLTAEVYSSKESPVIPVVVATSAVNDVNDEMVKAGFAGVSLKTHKLNQPQPHQHHAKHHQHPPLKVTPLLTGYTPEVDGMLWSNGNMPGSKGKRHKTKTSQNTEAKSVVSERNNHGGGGDDILQSQQAAQMQLLRQQGVQAQNEVEKLRRLIKETQESAEKEKAVLQRERDSSILELDRLKTNLKNLKDDYMLLTERQTERSLSFRLSKLVQSVNKVKEYRLQFPCQDACEDPIERSFKVVLDSDSVHLADIKTFQNVANAHNNYKAAQNAIRAAENVEELPELVATRDLCRTCLHEELTEFIAQVETLPLAVRANQLEESMKILEKTYEGFLNENIGSRDDIKTFEEAQTLYQDWKSHKLFEFQEARTRTNTCHNAINCALRTLQQQLSMESSPAINNFSTAATLDQLLDGFQASVEEEAQKTNLISDVNVSDASLVGTVLKILKSMLRLEQSEIHQLRRLQGEYTSLKNDISPWLTVAPDLGPVVDVRKEIKTHKSKLRHKMADLQDLVENEDSGTSDLDEIKEQLRDIRKQLHLAFIAEDEVLANFSELNENHFPELSLKHPDLGIDTVREHNSLVKQGRALDQYDLEPMPGTNKKTVYKTAFCGKEAVLKEYIVVEEGFGVKRTDFLRRAYYYNKIINPHILSVEAIFFTGVGRQVYVQLPMCTQNLTTLVDEDAPSAALSYKILRGVLMGLQAIHAANLVVGAIHPNNVLINSDAEAIISELDFSKTPHQRVGTFVSSSGMKFQPPEADRQEISWASDMYNLGLLALWLHFPSYKFSLKSNGVPDYSPLVMDQALEQLLMNLLQMEPASRRTSNSTWHLPYFNNSPYSRPSSPVNLQKKEETLQLRPKTDSRSPQTKSPNGGILKNKGTKSPTSTPRPASPQLGLSPSTDTLNGGHDESEAIEPKEKMGMETKGAVENDIPNDVQNELKMEPEQEIGEIDLESEGDVQNGDEPYALIDDLPPPLESAINVFGDSDNSTPVLVCSPLGTPRNTPVEVESGSSSPPNGHHENNNITGLVKDAVCKASQLLALSQLDDSDKGEDEEEVVIEADKGRRGVQLLLQQVNTILQ